MRNKMLAFCLLALYGAVLLFPGVIFAQLTTGSLGLEYGTPTQLSTEDVRLISARVINVSLGLLGTIAVVLIVVGGFKWMTAQGNEDQVGEAKKTMYYGIVGLAIILAAYAIAKFVVDSLLKATNKGA